MGNANTAEEQGVQANGLTKREEQELNKAFEAGVNFDRGHTGTSASAALARLAGRNLRDKSLQQPGFQAALEKLATNKYSLFPDLCKLDGVRADTMEVVSGLLFDCFDIHNNKQISYSELQQGLAMYLRGTQKQRVEWAFKRMTNRVDPSRAAKAHLNRTWAGGGREEEEGGGGGGGGGESKRARRGGEGGAGDQGNGGAGTGNDDDGGEGDGDNIDTDNRHSREHDSRNSHDHYSDVRDSEFSDERNSDEHESDDERRRRRQRSRPRSRGEQRRGRRWRKGKAKHGGGGDRSGARNHGDGTWRGRRSAENSDDDDSREDSHDDSHADFQDDGGDGDEDDDRTRGRGRGRRGVHTVTNPKRIVFREDVEEMVRHGVQVQRKHQSFLENHALSSAVKLCESLGRQLSDARLGELRRATAMHIDAILTKAEHTVQEQVDLSMRLMDVDGDGQVSMGDFRLAVQRNPKLLEMLNPLSVYQILEQATGGDPKVMTQVTDTCAQALHVPSPHQRRHRGSLHNSKDFHKMMVDGMKNINEETAVHYEPGDPMGVVTAKGMLRRRKRESLMGPDGGSN